jgi:hypothetical protein
MSSAATVTEWSDDRPHPISTIGWVWLVLVIGVPAALIAVLALLVEGAAIAIVAIVVYAALLVIWVLMQGRLALRSVAAERLEPGSAARLENLVAGLARDLGVEPPQIWTTARVGPNAMTATAGRPVLVVSAEGLETLTRTELEAILSHSLLRMGRARLWRGSLAAALGPAAGPAAPHTGPTEDALAAAAIQYPPALVSAIAKADPVRGRFAVLWFAGTGHHHAPKDARIAALNEL